MVTFTLMNDGVPEILLDAVNNNKIEPYEWTGLYLEFAMMQYVHGIRVEGDGSPLLHGLTNEEQLAQTIKSMMRLITEYPIFFVDKSLETLIEDTIPSLDDIKVPFPCVFINKRFRIGDTVVMGFFIQHMPSFLRDTLMKSNYEKKVIDEIIEGYRVSPEMKGKYPDISYSYISISPKAVVITVGDEEDVLYGEGMSKETKKLMEQVMYYAINVCNLLNSRANLKNPTDITKDVRIIPHYPLGRKNKGKFSYIRVFGELNSYVKVYEKERRKRTQNIGKYLVRGHWVSAHFRVYKHEKYFKGETYKGAVGRVVWIAKRWQLPFIKGSDKKTTELHQRLVKLKG